jgi:hypothetical protein
MRCASLFEVAKFVPTIFLGALVVALVAFPAESADDGLSCLSPPGDTHVHTDNSLDAKGFGANIGPEEAFRCARGEEVVASTEVSKVVNP